MAAGDAFNYISTVSITPSYYQPAAGVEILVTHFSSNILSESYTGVTNGSIYTYIVYGLANTFGPINLKLFITNSHYLRFATGTGTNTQVVSGVQIK